MNEHAAPQRVQVKVYESADRLTVAAPMPGLEPQDIAIEITPGNQLVLTATAGARSRTRSSSSRTNGIPARIAEN